MTLIPTIGSITTKLEKSVIFCKHQRENDEYWKNFGCSLIFDTKFHFIATMDRFANW